MSIKNKTGDLPKTEGISLVAVSCGNFNVVGMLTPHRTQIYWGPGQERTGYIEYNPPTTWREYEPLNIPKVIRILHIPVIHLVDSMPPGEPDPENGSGPPERTLDITPSTTSTKIYTTDTTIISAQVESQDHDGNWRLYVGEDQEQVIRVARYNYSAPNTTEVFYTGTLNGCPFVRTYNQRVVDWHYDSSGERVEPGKFPMYEVSDYIGPPRCWALGHNGSFFSEHPIFTYEQFYGYAGAVCGFRPDS